MIVLVPVSFVYTSLSPSPLAHHGMLFVSAMCLPAVKTAITMIVSGGEGVSVGGGEGVSECRREGLVSE